MRSTMMDVPLTVGSMLRHGRALYATSEVLTATGTGTAPRRRTFADVADRADRLAAALTAIGVTADDRVATFQWNTAEHLECYLAIPAMGAILHTLNIRLFPEQLVFVADHAADRVVIVDHSLLPVLVPLLPELRTVETVIVCDGPADDVEGAVPQQILSYEELLAGQSGGFDYPELDERSAAAMCYTSGTTGDPKGVVYSHRSTWLHAFSSLTANVAAIGESDRVLPVVPMFHANAWGYPYAGWVAGADLLMPSSGLTPAALAGFIHATRPTVAAGVPTIWNDLLRWGETHDLDLSSFSRMFCGGSAVPLSLMRRAHDEHGVEIVQGWGMTETSPIAAQAVPPSWVEPGSADYWDYRSSAGRVCLGVEARIVGDDGDVLPRDGAAVGELEVRGPWVSGSYYLDEDTSAFDDGWLRTGDVGSLTADGFIRISDRSKDVIKSGGEWISSVELENALAEHPSVREAAVVGVPDEQWGERPLAAVVGEDVTAGQLRDFLAGKVARWWLPERWTFLEAVPRTSVGKYDKKVLRAQYAAGELEVVELEGSRRSGP